MEVDENKIGRETTGLVLNLANSQYSVQWTKIGNLQTSASSVLSLIAIVATVVLGIVSSKNDFDDLLKLNSIVGTAFYITTIMSIVYMLLSCFFMYMILRTKYVQGGLPYPSDLQDQILDSINAIKDSCTGDQQILHTNVLLVEKIDFEIRNTDIVLEKNRFWYIKCLRSSFFSLAGSILSLLFINSGLLNNNICYLAILSIFSYLVLLSLIFVLFFPIRKRTKSAKQSKGESI